MIDLGVRHLLRRIKHTELHARSKQANKSCLELTLFEVALLYGVNIRPVVVIVFDFERKVNALIVHAALDADRGRLRLGGLIVVAAVDVYHGAAIGNDVPFKVPFTAELILEQELVCTSRLAVYAVVGAHDGARLGFGYGGAKGGQIRVKLIVLAHVHVRRVAGGFRSAVYCVMFGRRYGPIVFGIVTLHPGHIGYTHASGQKRIFAVRLLSAAPTWITEDVDVGRPEIQAFEDTRLAVLFSQRLCVLYAAFGPDDNGHLANQVRIESSAQADWFRELRCAIARHTVQRLAPPVVGGHLKARYRARLVHHLRRLLLERHPLNEIGRTLFRRQVGVKIRRDLALCPRCAQDQYPEQAGPRRITNGAHSYFHFLTSIDSADLGSVLKGALKKFFPTTFRTLPGS